MVLGDIGEIKTSALSSKSFVSIRKMDCAETHELEHAVSSGSQLSPLHSVCAAAFQIF